MVEARVTSTVPTRQRVALALIGGVIAGGVTLQKSLRFHYPRDFGQVWFAARAILHGTNPYPLVGPHLAYDWPFPLLYPLPAAVIALPLAPLSELAACVLFSALAGAAFAWALMEYGYGPLFGVFGASLQFAAETVQWSPLLAGALVVPWLSLFLVAKPTVGVAMFAARPSRWAVIGAVLFGGVAFAIEPGWVRDWLDAIAQNNAAWAPDRPYQIPLLAPGGVFALLCLLRWRRPEARLVFALACVPLTPLLYETVPLFLVPRTFWQSATLLGLSYVVHYLTVNLLPPDALRPDHLNLSGQLIVALLYLPCTWMILRRANEGTVPAWLERRIAQWPAVIRGRSHAAA
jgi:hypothetical protein